MARYYNRWSPESLRCDDNNNPIENFAPEPRKNPNSNHQKPKQIDYPILLSNGQRIYKAPSLIGKNVKRPKGAEVFVGNLPRNLLEDELIPLFSLVGDIFTIRLMMDFSGQTRGFAFVSYFQPRHADEAVRRFDNHQIRKDAFITVHKSVDNCRLFFGNVPRELTKREIRQELDTILEGIEDVILYQDLEQPKLNRGFVFVEFEDHARAAIARRRMLAGVVALWGRPQAKVFVDWAEPEPVLDEEVLHQVTVIFLKNVPSEFSSTRLKRLILSILGEDNGIARVYKKNNYAFLHFENKQYAVGAFDELTAQPFILRGKLVEVEWARPAIYSKRCTEDSVPNNLCMSVPPKTRKQIENAKKSATNRRRLALSLSSQTSNSSSSNVSSSNSPSTSPTDSRLAGDADGEVDEIARHLRKIAIMY